jgi:predicted RNA binding protein YcfA (HicA-like mRNA interferase family)
MPVLRNFSEYDTKVRKKLKRFCYHKTMAKKIRELIQDLVEAGFCEIKGTGKGSHRKFAHALYPGAVTISGKLGEDSKRYQEKQVRQAIEEVKK